jgi:uncharacterized damage-inducible protein DinB
MTSADQFQTLFAYHWEVTRRLVEAAARLSEADYRETSSYGRGSIHEVLLHLLRTGYAWRVGLETGERPTPLASEAFPDLASLRAGFETEAARWREMLGRMSPAEIEGSLELADGRGVRLPRLRWRILMHVLLHGMQHHSDIARLLTDKGQSPGDIDFLFFQA